MRRSKLINDFERNSRVQVRLPEAALATICDLCDEFEQDETGGRLIGTYSNVAGVLNIHVAGVIEAGPNALRSRVTFFQDGAYQEDVFRRVESAHPNIEHLGNWHTHHVNGLAQLSSGDIETYRRTVSHRNHNTDFFYALLVVSKRSSAKRHERYSVKHYLFRRGDGRVYEVPSDQVSIVPERLVWPIAGQPHGESDTRYKETDMTPAAEDQTVVPDGNSDCNRGRSVGGESHPRDARDRAADDAGTRIERVHDRDALRDLYPGFSPYASRVGIYWRGRLELIDGSRVEVVVLEDGASRGGDPVFTTTLVRAPHSLAKTSNELAQRQFPSARAALITTERACNRVLFQMR